MAGKSHTRLNLRQQETVRTHIKTTQIAKRLQKHVLEGLKLSSTQVRAAEVLLKKTIPDLKSSELTGLDGAKLFPDSITVNGVEPGTDTKPSSQD